MIDVGAEITVEHFVAGQKVDVTGTTIGKGFQGVIKRHHMGGGRATHGNSVSHRTHGSTGQRQDPGKVFKGKHMAGHMGETRVTTQNVEIVSTDADRGLILIRGAVPGSKGAWILVRDAAKVALPANAPKPAAIRAVQPVPRRTRLRPQRERNNGSQDHNAGRQGRRQGELSEEIFGLDPREDILQRVVRWQLAKKQQGTHKAKGRAEIARTGAEDVQAEGYGPRPSPFGARSAVPRRRQGPRPGRSQP